MRNKVLLFGSKKNIILFSLGAISSLGFSPLSLFFLTIICYSLSIYLIADTQKKTTACLLGFLFGLGYHIFSLYWIAISFELGNVGGYIAGGAAVVLLSAFLSLFTALAFYLIRALNIKLGVIYYAISIVFILSCLDWIKGNILWSFPWLPISAIWSFSEITLFPFSFLGTWGYSLITYALITGVFLLNIKIKYSLLLVCPFVFAISLYFLEKKPNLHSDKQLNIRLVQPNISQKEKWKPENQNKNFNELMSLSRKKGIKEIDLIIWPETSLNIDFNRVGKKEKIFRDFINDNNSVIVGAIRKEYLNNKMKIYNSLFLFNAESKAILTHDKAKLVPFGEFIPFKKLLKLDKFTNGSKDFSEGSIAKPMEIKNGLSFLPLICYEVIFPNLTKKNQKYDFIVNITNDGWYGYSFGPYQHLALARIRAVKEGKTLLRVANTGISAVINYNGNTIASLDLNKKGIIDKSIKLHEKNTLYKKYGDGLFYGLIGVLCLYLLIFYRIPR